MEASEWTELQSKKPIYMHVSIIQEKLQEKLRLQQHKNRLTNNNFNKLFFNKFVFSNIGNISAIELDPTGDVVDCPLLNVVLPDAEMKGLCQSVICQKLYANVT